MGVTDRRTDRQASRGGEIQAGEDGRGQQVGVTDRQTDGQTDRQASRGREIQTGEDGTEANRWV